MRITMKVTRAGAANPQGSASVSYMRGETYDMSEDWQESVARVFIDNKWAYEGEKRMEPPAAENKDAGAGPPPGTVRAQHKGRGQWWTLDKEGNETGGPYTTEQIDAWGLRQS